MKPVWVVDDDRSIRWVLEKALGREGIAFSSFASAQEALEALKGEAPQVLVSDIRMPGASGIELLRAVKQQHPAVPVIIMTAYSDLDSAVAAFHGGAYEYLAKPFDVDQAVALIRRALEESLREQAALEPAAGSPEILGQAPAMQEVFRAIGRLSQSNATVLITGESGTGKELVAQALHRHGARAAKPFVAINTAAMPRDLLESELFGHERGAFTGAQQLRRGRFEQAEGGTLFLDEIGDMPAELQTRLLRVLSDGTYYRVGGHVPLRADVRVIAATHQDLEQRVREGAFREDLFHRLNVIRLRMPPLRERAEDIPLLARHFLAHSAAQLGTEAKRLSDDVLAHLARFAFPGNVRQLQNLCHWLTVMAPGQVIGLADLPLEIRGEAAPAPANWRAALEQEVERRLARGASGMLDELTREFERALIRKALAHTGGRRIEAAALLGMGRNTITRKIQELGIDSEGGA
ncbi:MAG: nitrogen regulation protein NR(I) [Betaproteobacteria bacterium]|nr:MAG: nitrogen regulation protein NR(I) [Betaproteobacteria bacterium]